MGSGVIYEDGAVRAVRNESGSVTIQAVDLVDKRPYPAAWPPILDAQGAVDLAKAILLAAEVLPIDATTTARSVSKFIFGEPHEQLEQSIKDVIAEVVVANEASVRDRVLKLIDPEPCDAETMPGSVAPSSTCVRCVVREAFKGRSFPRGHAKRQPEKQASEKCPHCPHSRHRGAASCEIRCHCEGA